MYGGNGPGVLPATGGVGFWALLAHDPAAALQLAAGSWSGLLWLALAAFALVAALCALWRVLPRREDRV